ncbi:homoserine kinase [Jeotgalicoccus huakuii]|nr:homoserine kinase [Jeotgalicoccus huakuii]
MSELSFKVPASSANLGLGFDSIGVAVDLFLTVETTSSDAFKVEFKSKELEVLPSDETNLVFETALKIAKDYKRTLPPIHMIMDSDIPLSHGLGSSSSAIVAGIEIANHYLDLNLSDHEKVLIGCQIEGHPDNVGPCITGGAFVGYYLNNELYYYHIDIGKLGIIISVPNYEINTIEAREVLPNAYTRVEAVAQNALANVMILALQNQDYQLMGHLMMKDNFHEPYRQPLIKEFEEIKEMALKNGALATVISGAGPTVLTLVEENDTRAVLKHLQTIHSCEHRIVNVYKK